MALLRTRLFSGALFAGALFGAAQPPTEPPVLPPGGPSAYTRWAREIPYVEDIEALRLREQLRAEDEIMLAIIIKAVTEEIL